MLYPERSASGHHEQVLPVKAATRTFLLIFIMTCCCLVVTGVSTYLLYRAALNEEANRMRDIARTNALLLKATARFNETHPSDYPGGSMEAAMAQIREAHKDFLGLGETGEFTIGRREGDSIVYLLVDRHPGTDMPGSIPFDSELGEPMRRALSGLAGTLIGQDYHGNIVLAAHEPLPELGLGIVAKIDISEIRAPFIRAGLIAGLVTVLVVVIGALLFLKIADAAMRELQALNEMLTVRTDELARSNRELEQFAYVASHDLQEPLRIFSSYAQLLGTRYEGKLDADADDFIGYLVDGAARMQRLIEDLLTYSRVGTRGESFKMTNCNAIVEQAVENLALAVRESGAKITVEPLPTVKADAVQLAQLFQNIIGNAIKFRSGDAPFVRISAQKNEDKWVFSVKDNGIGIAPEYQDRIFVIFQRLHVREKYPGTGIGLAIARKIVERHGGMIWVESHPNAGSTFYFTLPDDGGEHP
jgi:signal transduction histidine kinase